MAKSSKKMHLPNFAKLGKYFKRKKSRKAMKSAEKTDEDGGPTTPTCLPDYSTIPEELCNGKANERLYETNKDCNGIEDMKICPEVGNQSQTQEKMAYCLNSRHVDDATSLKAIDRERSTITADIIVHSSGEVIKKAEDEHNDQVLDAKDKNVENPNFVKTTPEKYGQVIEKIAMDSQITVHSSQKEMLIDENTLKLKTSGLLMKEKTFQDQTLLKISQEKESGKIDFQQKVHNNEETFNKENIPQNNKIQALSSPERNVESPSFMRKTPEKDEEHFEELVYPVLIKTPTPFTRKKSQEIIENGSAKKPLSNGNHVPCTVIVHTPIKMQTSNGFASKAEAQKCDEKDDDFELMDLPATPPPLKQTNRASKRVSTVKKIRSIISTPYKRIKRESSLLDGQTYRYIEIQSLVNAFQTLHPCNSGMVACNEKGLQYGKSSVLRIECKDCDTKVFLQATK